MERSINSQLFQALYDHVDVAIMVLGYEDGILLYVNRQVTETLRTSREQIEGKHFREVFEADFIKHFEAFFMGCQDGAVSKMVYYWKEQNIWEQISAVRVPLDAGRHALVLTITNITDSLVAEFEYKRLAYFDPVSGLPNSYMLEQDISEITDTTGVAMLYFQLERFVDINDLYGIEVGDCLLLRIRDWLQATEKRSARLYRVADGFALLGLQVTYEDAVNRSREIIRRFEEPWTLSVSGQEYSLYRTAKLGIVYGRYIKNEMRSLLMRTMRASDTAQGYTVYDERVIQEARDSLRLRQMLINCLQQDMHGFEVHYQPIVEAKTRRWVGAEALCRWTAPTGERISPIRFIHLAELLGEISRLDNWVRETAMRYCVNLGLNNKDFYLDVNFSPTRNIDEAFVDGLMHSLHITGYPFLQLNMEITESAKMVFSEDNIRGLRSLASKGISLSLDDFGTGYSSFENLIRVPASALKTEKLFIDGIEKDPYKQYLMQLMIGLAHHLGMSLIAEGVETQEQLEILESLGADYFQGYLFSRPLSGEQLAKEAHRFADRTVAQQA